MTGQSRQIFEYLRRDWAANRHDPKSHLVLVLFRVCQFLSGGPVRTPRKAAWPAILVYRFITEFILGIELRPKTTVGPGLRLYHGFGIVINDHSIIGSDVTIRHGVTIGHSRQNGACPIIKDGANLGAGACIIGAVTVGEQARVAPNALVLTDVPAGRTAIGNPAKIQ